MHRCLCFVGAHVLGFLVVSGCNENAGPGSMPGEPPAAAGGATSTSSGSSGSGGSSGSDSGASASGGSSSGGLIPIPIPASASIAVASSWAALQAGQTATSFDVLRTDDLFVVAKVGPAYEGQSLGLNFQSPSGGVLAGYVSVVSHGEAQFVVKLGGTAVGKSAQTGTFPLILGHLGTQQPIARTTVTLVKGVAQ